MPEWIGHPYYIAGLMREFDRIVEIIHTQHKPEHIENPSGVCRACRILELINVA
jgi:hypothetical protein